jgi:hypothetical protein
MLSGSIIPWCPSYLVVLPLASMLSGSIIPWYPCSPAVSPLAFMLSGSFTPGIHAIWQYYPLVSLPLLQNIPNYPHNSAPSRKCCLVWAIKSFCPPPPALPPPLGHRVWPAAQSLLSLYQEFAKIVCKINLSRLCLPNDNKGLHEGSTEEENNGYVVFKRKIHRSAVK